MAASQDYHQAIWEAVKGHYCDGISSTFVMSTGMSLDSADYDVTNPKASYNTSVLVDNTLRCSINYEPTLSHVSTLWELLLNNGKGPNPGPSDKEAFENAKRLLYFDYSKLTRSKLYDQYYEKQDKCRKAKQKLENDLKKQYGDSWMDEFDKQWPTRPALIEYKDIQKKVEPLIAAIDVWENGTLYSTIKPLKDSTLVCLYILTDLIM